MTTVTVHPFGTTDDGQAVTLFCLQNGAGSMAELLDYGCIIRGVRVPNRAGALVDVVLGYDSVAGYQQNDGYFGAAIGRHANRLAKGRMTLGGRVYQLATNDHANHLHGGSKGFDRYVWEHQVTENGVTFSRVSPDGEEQYPGTLRVSVAYTFDDENRLDITYHAVSDGDTVVNLTNHSYFNLDGGGSVADHTLWVDAQQFTENSSECMPTGKLLPVEGTPLDFRTAARLGNGFVSDYHQVKMFGGYDHNFVLGGSGYRSVAKLASANSGIAMEVFTTKPGVQLYTANMMQPRTGKGGAVYGPHGAACLETQYFPNSMECANFPSPVLAAGKPYHHRTTYCFTVSPSSF
ncbi:MAG: aldose epimerase family protein [Angelakisella sp.]